MIPRGDFGGTSGYDRAGTQGPNIIPVPPELRKKPPDQSKSDQILQDQNAQASDQTQNNDRVNVTK